MTGEYPKINTLWKRDESTHRLIEGAYSQPEFETVSRWRVTEKVDGTNIRVIRGPPGVGDIVIRGRTDNAQIPPALMSYLGETFTHDRLEAAVPEANVTLYGEGYGPKIQSGGRYRGDAGFILFDCLIDGTWLEFDNVKDIASKLGIPSVPDLGIMSEGKIVSMVQEGFASLCAEDTTLMAEGVVATSAPMMLTRYGERPVRWKLKARDFA